VGVALDRSPEMIAAIYGIARAGAVCVPLDVTYPADRVAAMIHRSTPLRVITAAQHAGLVPDPSLVLLVNEVTAAGTDENPAPLPVIDRDSLLYVLFTSGSTGEPKGVAMPHRALDNYQAWQVAAASGAAGGRTLQFAPLSFDVSFQEIYTTISGGGLLQIIDEAERRDMAALLRLLDSAGVERVFVPYVALQQLAETADLLGLHPRKLRVVISSGEQLRITAEIRRFMAALPAGAVLENQYGPTETHLVTAHLLSGDPEAFPNLPPIGSVTGGVECHLLDERMRPVPTGVSGELYFGGIQLADGYFGRPALTEQRFIANPFGAPGSRLYRTGDIARFMPDGTLMWIARSDTQTKIRGYRVEPLEVELAVMREPGVSEAAVVVRRREGVDAFLAAFLVGDEDAVDLDGLRKRLRSTLPDYMVPSHFTWLPAMPLTPSGKRNDAELRRMPLTTGSASTSAPPRDDCERELAELMADLLQLREVGIHDALFDIGGTSLTAMRLVALVEKRYGMRIPLATFVSAPTVAGLAEVVRHGNGAFVFDPLVTLRPDGDRRPLFLVHPIGGNVLCYLRLAGHLPADQPVYALQAPGGEVGTEPLASVGELADRYLEAIRRVQPEGPYAIGGWSFGGMVAFELAHRLPVDQLLIIDTIVRRPRDPAAVDDRTLLEWFFWELLLMENGGHRTLDPLPAGLDSWEAALDHVGAGAAAAGVLRQGTSRAAVDRLYRVFRAHWQAIVDYRPEPIGADLTLLRAAQPLPPALLPMHNAAGGTLHDDPLNGWGGLTRGRIDVVEVPGDHLAMVEEPHVAELARVLAELLRPAGGAA
jgi:amino acid adenylation domain-containing protein